MSWREIEVSQRFTVQCSNCDFKWETNSAGGAEDAAHCHIDEWTEDGFPNYNHVCGIVQVTVVARY